MIAPESTEDESFVSYALKVDEMAARIGGVIQFLCALYMLVIAWKRRQWLFHRLVFGMSIYLMVASIFLTYGKAAIPGDKPNMLGSRGTITTCTIQGFSIYVCMMTSIFYYVSFSVYSYVGVLNNFEKAKIVWVEKWIHLLVHLYPISTGIYLLVVNGFNNSGAGFCYITSSPLGCEYDPNITCDRGPQHYIKGRLIHTVVEFIALLVPTAVMITLYFVVRKRQTQIHISAKILAQQSFVYIIIIYWHTIPYFIFNALPENMYPYLDIFTAVNGRLFGVTSLLVYWYFTIEKNVKRKTITLASANLTISTTTTTTPTTTTTTTNNNNNNNESKLNPYENAMTQTDIEENKNSSSENINYIFRTCKINDVPTQSPALASALAPASVPAPTPATSISSQPKYSFNIFDGTNASGGGFAEFIHAGDSEDEKVDDKETKHWEAVQDYV